MMTKAFLHADWKKLIIANYAVEKELLQNYLPYKTELDYWSNECYVSLVGFMFLKTRVRGCRIPFHTNFEEVNLRFYVRYRDTEEWKRGVVFIREIVPRPAIALVANTIYKENYESMPMSHIWREDNDSQMVEYRWKKKKWNQLQVTADKTVKDIRIGSKEEFIIAHDWGYTRVNEKQTLEYRVEHPRWRVYDVKNFLVNVDFGQVYGTEFSFLSHQEPASVFLAEGSGVIVRKGQLVGSGGFFP